MTNWTALADEVVAMALGQAPRGLGEWSTAVEQLNARIHEDKLPDGIVGRTRQQMHGGAAITLDARLTQTRRTFTAAHELGHIMLWRSAVVSQIGEHLPSRPAEVEALCDAIAGSLLVPGPWVATLDDAPPRLSQLLPVARHFGMSPSVFAIRLTNLNRYCLLLSARNDGTGWRWAYHSGRIPGMGRASLDAQALTSLMARCAPYAASDSGAGSWRLDATDLLTHQGRRRLRRACSAWGDQPRSDLECNEQAADDGSLFVDVVTRGAQAALVWVRPSSWTAWARIAASTARP